MVLKTHKLQKLTLLLSNNSLVVGKTVFFLQIFANFKQVLINVSFFFTFTTFKGVLNFIFK